MNQEYKLEKIYFFVLDENGRETKAVEIALDTNGVADISNLPENTKKHLEDFGIINITRTHIHHPADGALFLQALLDASDQKWHFRLNPELQKYG